MSAPARPRIAKTALALAPFQLFFRGGEAMLPILLAAWFGRDPAMDVYFLVSAWFVLATSLVASAFHDSALVPILLEQRARDSASIPRFLGSIFAHTLVAGAAGAVALAAAAALALSLRWDGALVAVGVRLCVAFAPYVVLVAVRAFFVGVLNAHNRFTAHPVAGGVGVALAVLIMLALHDRLGVLAVPVALSAGELASASILAWITVKIAAIAIAPNLSRPEPARRFFRLATHDVLGSSVTRVNPVIDQLVATFAGVAGGGAIVRYAMDVGSVPASILQATVLPVLLSHLAHDAAAGDRAAVVRTARRAAAIAFVALAAVAFLLSAARGPLLELVFLHGHMDAGGVGAIADVVPWALAGAAPFGALLVLARAHVALQNSRIMLPLGLANAALNAALDVVLLPRMGLSGIALSTTLVHAAIAGAFGWLLFTRLARSSSPRDRPSPRTT